MTKKKVVNIIIFLVLCALTVIFLYPLFFILVNSFKGKFYISSNPFALPTEQTFSGLTNYTNGLLRTGLINAIGYSFFITIVSVVMIIFFFIYDSLLYFKSAGSNHLHLVLYVYVFHDCAFSDGNVYND